MLPIAYASSEGSDEPAHPRKIASALTAHIHYEGAVILLPAHPASFAHKFLFQRVPGCNSIADLPLKIVFYTDKFAVGTQ